MNVAKLFEPVATMQRRAANRIRESSTHFPYLRRKRRVILLWLMTAHGAQIVTLALFLFLQFGFPRLREAVLDRAFPESVAGKLVGLFGGESRADRYRRVTGQAATMFAWIGSGSIAFLMFWVRIPAAMSRSATIAREREAEADALLGSTPSRSVMLYQSALALACDPEYQEALEKKIRDIDDHVLGSATAADGPESYQEGSNVVAGRYAIAEELGSGANGVVYRAHDSVLGREVALKELPIRLSNDDFLVPRFRQEARALARLNHPNIVQVYDFIEHERRMWMAIELVEGGNLGSYLARRGVLAAPEACWIGAKIAEAVAFAHDRGVIHRDLKPLNVLLADKETPKVTDFGLAKLTEGGVDTAEGTVMGSPHYMSPEQAQGGAIDHRTDIYSLGVILYQMLTGRVPFEGEIASVLAQHIRKPPRRLRDVAPNNDIPPSLERQVLTMLSKGTGDRPAAMQDVATALARHSRRRARS